MIRKVASLIGLACALVPVGCVSKYGTADAAAAPSRISDRQLEAESWKPAAPGNGRVVLSSETGTAQVREVLEEARYGRVGIVTAAKTRVVCEHTPCAAELSLGDHDIRFVGAPTGDFVPSLKVQLKVNVEPTAYRVALSQRASEPTPTFGVAKVTAVIGFILLAAGGIGFGISDGERDPTTDQNNFLIPTVATAATGLVVLFVSTILQLNSQGKYVPGSTSTWAIDRR